MSIFKGFVDTLRVLPTAFYTPTSHVYIFVHWRLPWEDFGGIFSCLAYVHVPTSAFFRNVLSFPILVRLLCKYLSRIGGITFSSLLLTLCPYLRVLLLPCTFVLVLLNIRVFRSELFRTPWLSISLRLGHSIEA